MERPAGSDGSGVIPMDNLAYIVAGVLAVDGAISTLGGAANWVVKLVQVLKAPNAEQDKRLESLEKHMKEVDTYLAADKDRLDSIDESTRVTQRALLALLAHGIDGNHQKQMEDAKVELELYLIKKITGGIAMILEIINMYGAEIIGTLLVALAGIFGMVMKRIAEKVLDTPVKMQLAKIAVQFTEQTYKELHGKEKLSAALIAFEGLLAEKKIYASADEMHVLIEAAVAEFNEVFKKPAVKVE